MEEGGRLREYVCKRCGTTFESEAFNVKYCPKCRVIVAKEKQKSYRRDYHKNIPKPVKMPEPQIPVSKILEICRKRGMTYGQTVVWLKYHHPNGRRKMG